MSNFLLGMVIALALYTLSRVGDLHEDDMAACQLSHSFDTCHKALN